MDICLERRVMNNKIKPYPHLEEEDNDLLVVNDGNLELNFESNSLSLVRFIKKGMPYGLFEKIKTHLPFDDDMWASFLNVSTKSMQRYKTNKTHTFKPIHTEKILEIAEVNDLGIKVFGGSIPFNNWLNEPCFALGNLKPIELLYDSYGKQMLIDELNKIEYGIFS